MNKRPENQQSLNFERLNDAINQSHVDASIACNVSAWIDICSKFYFISYKSYSIGAISIHLPLHQIHLPIVYTNISILCYKQIQKAIKMKPFLLEITTWFFAWQNWWKANTWMRRFSPNATINICSTYFYYTYKLLYVEVYVSRMGNRSHIGRWQYNAQYTASRWRTTLTELT